MVITSKKKNNHFVPKSYLRRFCSKNDKQISLYNIKSDKTIEVAPIKSQCSRDYFYTKNPVFENDFAQIEARQKIILDKVSFSQNLHQLDSVCRSELSSVITFQAGRTVSAADHDDHIANQLSKSILRHHFEREKKLDLLEYLKDVNLFLLNPVMDSIARHLLMGPLINDLDCTLFRNETSEDFLTSDHPVVLCSGLPGGKSSDRRLGFASPGLIILYPISPREILFLSDPEAYKIESLNGISSLCREQDIVDLNLAQFSNAHENVYFSKTVNVARTLKQFRETSCVVRVARPAAMETAFRSPDGRRGIILHIPVDARRQRLPKCVQVKYSFKRRIQAGLPLARDESRVLFVNEQIDKLHKLRDARQASSERKEGR